MSNDKPKIQKIGVQEATGVMRGRDVRFKLAERRDIDPALVEIMAEIAEINHTNTIAVMELASMFNQMIDTFQQIMNVAGNMKDALDKMGFDPNTEGDPNAKSN